MKNAVHEQAGRKGCRVVKSGTTAHTADAHDGPWGQIQIVTDTVFTTCVNQKNAGEGYDGVTWPAGQVLFGTFTAVERLSGTYILYKEG